MSAVKHPGRSTTSRFTRHAWWSLLGLVPSFFLAFLIGEGLIALLGYPPGGSAQAPRWAALIATVPALMVFVLPALVCARLARRGIRVVPRR